SAKRCPTGRETDRRARGRSPLLACIAVSSGYQGAAARRRCCQPEDTLAHAPRLAGTASQPPDPDQEFSCTASTTSSCSQRVIRRYVPFQERMNPSSSPSAQARVFSIGSPCRWRTIILVISPWV